MRFVELKSAEQLDMQMLHRARERLVPERTALINQLRAVLMEPGIIIPQGRRKLNRALSAILEGNEADLTPRVRMRINDMRSEWDELDQCIRAFADEFAARTREDEDAGHLAAIPGIGVLNAMALVAAIGKGQSLRAAATLQLGSASSRDKRRLAESHA
jgi:transposase